MRLSKRALECRTRWNLPSVQRGLSTALGAVAAAVSVVSVANAADILNTLGGAQYCAGCVGSYEFDGWQELAVPFSTTSAVTATDFESYAWNAGAVIFGVMADAGGAPSGDFLYELDAQTSPSNPFTATALNWTLGANSNYWVVGVLSDPVVDSGTTEGSWNSSSASGPFVYTNYQVSQFAWRPTNGALPAVFLGTSAPTASGGGVSAAPEPTTWALMFVGIGLLGSALRIRRSKFVA